MRIGSAASLLALCVCFGPVFSASAQWAPAKTPNVPRLPNGNLNAAAPAPKTADGKPDFSGIWTPEGAKFNANIAADLKPEDVPFKPEAAAIFKVRQETFGKDDPDARCLPSGQPRKSATPSVYKIVQSPGLILFLYESRTTFRQIFMDGRPLPVDPQPTFDGYSVGRWEGDTLVVETNGLTSRAWLDTAGHPISEAAHLTERFRRPNFGTLDLEITIDDPGSYTKPWKVTEHPHLLVDTELTESICNENEKDQAHLVGK